MLSGARILIIDDEPANVVLLERLLEREGYTRITATTSPQEGLELFNSTEPDLVLLDLAMPNMDGFEVMRRLRSLPDRASAPVPIVVLTADVTPETKRKALTSGANDFLTKPFEHEEVLARVANLLETRTLHLELADRKERLEEEVRRRTEELSETEARLFQSQKMEAIGQLAGGIAHDFNNLLSVIINYAILLLEDMDPNDRLREEVLEIQRAGESAATLTRQLLAFSRKEVVSMVALDLNEVVRNVQRLLHRTIGEDIRFVVELSADLSRAKLDAGQVEQVLLNLAVNARDAMPGGGTLSIRTFDASMDATFVAEHPGARLGDYACIQVSDTGIGMPDEVKARVFEPFFTTKERGVGTGLGLATVYGVVKHSDGYVDVESALGEGSTFTLYFPVTAEALEDKLEQVSKRIGGGEGERILVAEDSDGLRGVIERLLTRNGFEVLPAERGGRALELAGASNQRIDLLLTDVVMPGMSGKDLADAVGTLHPGLPIIYMSGYTDQVIGEAGSMENGVLLRKPFTEPELIRAVHDALSMPRAEERRA